MLENVDEMYLDQSDRFACCLKKFALLEKTDIIAKAKRS
jgi:hypothetical protein